MTLYGYQKSANSYLLFLSVLDDPLFYRLNQGVNLVYAVAGSAAFLNQTSTVVASTFERLRYHLIFMNDIISTI